MVINRDLLRGNQVVELGQGEMKHPEEKTYGLCSGTAQRSWQELVNQKTVTPSKAVF